MGKERWLPAITGVFVTSLIVSNIIAVKLISVGPIFLTAAIILFPVSYIFGDILTEVYGYARARQVIWIGFGCNLLLSHARANHLSGCFYASVSHSAGFPDQLDLF